MAPVKKIDEYEHFSKFVKELNNDKHELLTAKLNKTLRNELALLLEIRRITLSEGNSVPRKVIRSKHGAKSK